MKKFSFNYLVVLNKVDVGLSPLTAMSVMLNHLFGKEKLKNIISFSVRTFCSLISLCPVTES